HGDRVRPCRNTAHALLTLEVAFSHRMHLRARPPRPSRVPHGGHAGTPPGSCRLWGVSPCPPTPTRAGPFHVKRVAILPATAMGPRCPDEPISARSTHHGWSGEHSAGDAPHVRRWLAIARGRPRLPSRGRVRPIDRSPHRISSEAAEQLSPPATPNKTLDGST